MVDGSAYHTRILFQEYELILRYSISILEYTYVRALPQTIRGRHS